MLSTSHRVRRWAIVSTVALLGACSDGTDPGTPVTIQSNSVPHAVQGTAYTTSLAATGGNGTIDWSVSTGALPAGLMLSDGGALSGTPTIVGPATFTVKAASGKRSATQELTLVVEAPLVITTSVLAAGVQGQPYSATLAATGAVGSYTWTVATGSLPSGMGLSPAGVLSGVPGTPGTYTFSIQVTSGTQSVTLPFTMLVATPLAITTSSPLPAATQGTSYSTTLAASGGLGTYSWLLAAGSIPPGIGFTTAGVLSGVPTAAGTYVFTVRALSGAQAVTAQLTLVVGPPLTITTAATLPAGNQNTPYSTTLAASGASGSINWSLLTGSLPIGVTLDASTGTIAGTPSVMGTFTFTVQATSGSQTASKAFSMTINQPSTAPTTLAIVTQPAAAVSGVKLVTQPVVQVRDASNTLVSGSTVAVSVAIASGSGTLVGTTTVNAIGGVATFTDLRINGAGAHTLAFTAAALTAATSSSIVVTQTLASLAFATAPDGASSGLPLTTQPVVRLLDNAGLLIATSNAAVTATIATGTGTLGGATTVSSVGGVASFTNLQVNGSGTVTLKFTAGATSITSGSIAVANPGFNLTMASATITQVVQRPDNSVSMVAGNAALVSVYATTTQALPVGSSLRVRVRIYKGATLLIDDTRAATGGISSTVNLLAPTHQLLIPGAQTQSGISLFVELNPAGVAGEIVEPVHGDNVYPASGTPLALDVRTMPTLAIRFVPIFLAMNSATSIINQNLIDTKYLPTLRQIHPVNSLTTTIASTFTLNLDLAGGDLSTFWSPALQQLDAKRVADGGDANDYGVVPIPTGTHSVSTGGIAYIPSSGTNTGQFTRTAMGVDATFNWSNPIFGMQTMAHELGHNMGRRHAPCGDPSGVDPNYPYPGAVIGVVGWNVYNFANGLSASPQVENPATDTDIMSYCYDWISDYTYQGIIDFRTTVAAGQAARSTASGQTLLVSGIVRDGVVDLAPSYVINTKAVMPNGAGAYVLEGLDAQNRSLFRYRFTPSDVDHRPGEAQFTFAIPLTDATRDALVTVRATNASGAGATQSSARGRSGVLSALSAAGAAGAAGAARTADGFALERMATGRLRVRWNSASWKGVMARDPDTGEVLAFGRSGDMVVQTSKSSVVLLMSDGVQSGAQRVVIP